MEVLRLNIQYQLKVNIEGFFFESLDLAVNCIQQIFDQKGFTIFSNIEQLLFICTGKSHSEELDKVCEYFNDDFNIKKSDFRIDQFERIVSVIIHKTFSCFSDFMQWKEQEEQAAHSWFVMHNASKKLILRNTFTTIAIAQVIIIQEVK